MLILNGKDLAGGDLTFGKIKDGRLMADVGDANLNVAVKFFVDAGQQGAH